MTDVPHIVDVETVARFIGVSDREVRRQCECGVLPATKIGRMWVIAGEVITGPSTDQGR